MTYTTAQLRLTIKNQLAYAYYNGLDKKGYSQSEEDTAIDDILSATADYISQLELPKEWDLQECPNTEIVNSWCNRCFYCRNRDDYRFRDGYDRCLDDTATTLQKAAEQLRRTQ